MTEQNNKAVGYFIAAIIIAIGIIFYGYMNKIAIVDVNLNISQEPIQGDINMSGDLLMNGYGILNAGVIQADEFYGELNWSWLKGYPDSCPNGSAIQKLGDEIICINLSVYNNTGENTEKAGGQPYLYNDSDFIYYNGTYGNYTIDERISIAQIDNDQLPPIWVNRSISSADAYFKWNTTNETLELWVNDIKQQDWGASTRVFTEATFFDTAFFQNIFLQSAAGDAVLLNTTLVVLGNTTSTFYFGSGRYLTDVCLTNGTGCNLTFLEDNLNITLNDTHIKGTPYWLYDNFSNMFFNESHYNQTTQDLAEVKTYETFINFTSTGGSFTGQSTETLDFQITRITVTPNSSTTKYRFLAVKDSNGDIIDQDRTLHTGIWDIEKAVAIDNDYVNITLTNINPDDTFSVKITFIDNFRP